MDTRVKRGHMLLLVLLGAVCVISLVNVFYPLYLSPPQSSNRIMGFFLISTLAALAYSGVRYMRTAISCILFILALYDSLVLFAALSDGRLGLSLGIGSIVFVHVLIGWLLLTSTSVRAFEAARRQRTAKP